MNWRARSTTWRRASPSARAASATSPTTTSLTGLPNRARASMSICSHCRTRGQQKRRRNDKVGLGWSWRSTASMTSTMRSASRWRSRAATHRPALPGTGRRRRSGGAPRRRPVRRRVHRARDVEHTLEQARHDPTQPGNAVSHRRSAVRIRHSYRRGALPTTPAMPPVSSVTPRRR